MHIRAFDWKAFLMLLLFSAAEDVKCVAKQKNGCRLRHQPHVGWCSEAIPDSACSARGHYTANLPGHSVLLPVRQPWGVVSQLREPLVVVDRNGCDGHPSSSDHVLRGMEDQTHSGNSTLYYCNAVMRSVASVCLSVCPVRALTFESLDLEISFLVCGFVSRMSWSFPHIKVMRSRSRSQYEDACLCDPFGL